MELKDRVVSLELSREMKELGFEQQGLWWYGKRGLVPWGYFSNSIRANLHNYCTAYTVSELGEILIKNKHNFMPYFCDQRDSGWVYNFGEYPDYVKADTEADCRALMLIYLKKKGLI